MKFHSGLLTVCLAFITIASGTPTTSSHGTTKTSSVSTKTATPSATSVATTFDINFDERTVLLGAVPALNAVGDEKTIFFNSWVLLQPTEVDGAVVGVPPHSLPNGIVTGFEQQSLNGTPSLTVLYPGSTIKSYDFHSFWFGCVVNSVEGAAGVPTQCTVTVSGFQNDKEVAVASFTFTPPTGELSAPMIKAVLPAGFVQLQNASLVQDDPTLEALIFDDFDVTTHT